MYHAQARIYLEAPPTEVWEYFSHYRNFDPLVVQMRSQDPCRWKLRGSMDDPLEKASVLRWHSQGGLVHTRGLIWVWQKGSGSMIQVYIEYTLPGGAMGQTAVNLFDNPQRMLDYQLEQLVLNFGKRPTIQM